MERLLRDPRTTDSPPVLGIAGYFTEPASPEAGWALLRILVIVAIAGTPLLLWPGLLLSHDVMPKVILLSWTAALLLLTLPRWVHRPERLFYGLMALEVASLLLSAAFSTRPGLSFAGTVWRRFGVVEQTAVLVIAMAAAGFASDRWKLVLFRAMSVTGAVGASYGIAQYFGFDPFLDQTLYAIPYFGGIVRPPATMGHAIYFAS